MMRWTKDDFKFLGLLGALALAILLSLAWELGRILVALHFVKKLW